MSSVSAEEILKRFSEHCIASFNSQVFYFEDLKKWVADEFKDENINTDNIVEDILNLDSIIEIGDSAYKFVDSGKKR